MAESPAASDDTAAVLLRLATAGATLRDQVGVDVDSLPSAELQSEAEAAVAAAVALLVGRDLASPPGVAQGADNPANGPRAILARDLLLTVELVQGALKAQNPECSPT